MTTTRGTSNSNQRGSSDDRRRRREWLVKEYRANMDFYEGAMFWNSNVSFYWPADSNWFADADIEDSSYYKVNSCCRCYRCGKLLTTDTVTVDRRVPGCQGGTYRRDNIRPACGPCNSETGGRTRSK